MTTKQLPAGDWRIAVYGRGQVSGSGQRRKPRVVDQQRIIERQGYKCLYCEIPIATRIWRRNREIMLRPHWDHFVPYAYSQRNPSANWVLACHVCNHIKTARIFADVESARRAILPQRIAKGYEEPGAVFYRLGLERDQHVVLVTVARPAPRQLEALQLVAAGLSASEASIEMGIGHSRVLGLLRYAALRMGVETREEAIEIAIRNGFINRPQIPAQPTSEAS